MQKDLEIEDNDSYEQVYVKDKLLRALIALRQAKKELKSIDKMACIY